MILISPTIVGDLNFVSITRHVVHHADIGFTIVADVCQDAYHADFRIYESKATDMVGQPLYGDDFDITDWQQASVYASGSVKWDGCSNWKFDEQENCMLHGCNRNHLTNLGEVLARCWDMTKDILPTWG